MSSNEQLVYLTLFESGKSSARDLSKQTKIPRASVYDILQALIEKGIVSREQSGSSSLFLANHPTAFQRTLAQEKEQVSRKEKAVNELVDYLSPLFSISQFSVPKVRVFEGQQNIESMLFENWPLWQKSCSELSNGTLWGFQDPSFVESYLQWHLQMWASRKPNEKICLFSHEADVEIERGRQVENRFVRALPKGVHFSSSFWIYGEYIVMGITSKKPHYAVQIKDRLFGDNLRTIFQLLWEK